MTICHTILIVNTQEDKTMKNEVTAYAIYKVLRESNCGVSALAIAERANIDSTSENLRLIQDECFAGCDHGILNYRDLRYQGKNGSVFFWIK